MAQQQSKPLKRITLENDFGGQISFTGYLDGERMDYNEASSTLISEKIYRSEQGRVGYSVVVAQDDQRERRAYLLEQQNETCMVSNGSLLFGFDTEMMLTFLGQALDEDAASQNDGNITHIKKQLQAANE